MKSLSVNFTVDEQSRTSNGHERVLNSSFYCACLMILLCILGIFGNSLSVFVFSRKAMRCSINVLLTALSAIDLLLLIVVIPIFAVPALNVGNSETINVFCHIMVVYVYPVSMMLQSASVWLFVLITVERYLAILHPLHVAVYCSIGRARLAIVLVIFSSIVYNVIRFWEYTLENEDRLFVSIGLLRLNAVYWLWYGTVLYLLTQFLLPFILIAVLNTRMVRTILEAKRRRSMLITSERCEHRTALMMVVVVVTFASCYTLSFVLNFIEFLDGQFFFRSSTEELAFLLNDLSNTLVTFNSASTFVIYLVFSKRYRFFASWFLFSLCPDGILRRCINEEAVNIIRDLSNDRALSFVYTSKWSSRATSIYHSLKMPSKSLFVRPPLNHVHQVSTRTSHVFDIHETDQSIELSSIGRL